MLNWHSLIPSHDRRFMVKGHELAMAFIPGTHSRYAVYEVRYFEADGMPNVFFRVRDAATVSDENVFNGIRAKVVWEGKNFEEFFNSLTPEEKGKRR